MQTHDNCSSILSDHQTHTPSTVIFDLADTDTVDRAAAEILKCYGQVDVLINNAGISYRGNILDTQLSVQRDVMETNYFGPIALIQGWCTVRNFRFRGRGRISYVRDFFIHYLVSLPLTALLPSMVRRRSGHIVVISSIQGKIAIPYRSACKLSLLM